MFKNMIKKKKFWSITCYLLLVFTSTEMLNAQVFPDKYIDSLANVYLSSTKENSLLIGINVFGKEKIYRYANTGSVLPADSSVFEIGQVTQVFTSALYAQMTIRGIIRADEKLENFLPVTVPSPEYQNIICSPVIKDVRVPIGQNIFREYEYTGFVCKPEPGSQPQPILLCYLSTHTSGLPDKPGNLRSPKSNPYAKYNKEDLYEFLRSYSIPKKIGFDFQYSNLGVALLGHAMELKANRSYEDLIVDSICSPLGMTDTRVTFYGNELYRMKGHSKDGAIVPFWTYDVLAPSGGLHSTGRDMMKFLASNLGTTPSSLKDMLDYTHNPRIVFTSSEMGKASVGLNWFISPLKNDKGNFVWQSGMTGGFASYIGFVETSKRGVLILSNASVPVEETGRLILEELEKEISE